MPDPAPVALRFRKYFHPVSCNPVDISAVGAIVFLHEVEVFQLVPVDLYILFPPDIRDSVERKAKPMVHFDPQVQDHDRENGQEYQGIRGEMTQETVFLQHVFHGDVRLVFRDESSELR
jgi:hypothetical protein